MAQFFQRLWDRAQGKWNVQRICDKVFDDCADRDKNLMELSKLHLATLMVYNSINKQLLSPHKEPPSMATVNDTVNNYRLERTDAINREEFHQLIMEWVRKDLRIVLVNRIILAFLGAPALAVMTKKAGRRVPRIGNAVEKVPAPLLFSLYSVGLVLLQDARVD
ncbi:uncharacterized protein [Typha angustifolia]|uniref:uncharacterized protein n=1 Tax=Typha angustifolia TaxID=59011 RepID=UPI003C2D9C13